MFSKYLGDAEATRRAHDADGFFKTGDSKRSVFLSCISLTNWELQSPAEMAIITLSSEEHL
jgi:hypothetical protein